MYARLSVNRSTILSIFTLLCMKSKIIASHLPFTTNIVNSTEMSQQPQVTIEQGTLRGTTDKDIRGSHFFKFQGIPYAKPPTGELRFKPPVPPDNWSGIYDATKERDQCYSPDVLREFQISGSEDCLFLNVYTKSLNGSRPVLFWIHGGGFLFGSGNEDLYGPHFLMTEEVVLVTINYRLAIFGFLHFEDPSLGVPGNAGMKDQVMALRWVQKNIRQFGGDPNNVTIFGESAGGASVHLHVLSPMSRGLFHRAIAQSGCALNPWVTTPKGGKDMAKLLELEGADESTIYNALLAKSKEEILEIQMKLADSFVPSVQRPASVVVEQNSEEAFLPDEPINIILSGKFSQVPFMLGYTTSEGIFFEVLKNILGSQPPLCEGCLPWAFGYSEGNAEAQLVVAKIKNFYFGDEEPSEKNISKKIDLLTDVQFVYGIHDTILAHLGASKSPIYLYKMSIETELNFFKKWAKVEIPGVSHCDDLGYLFTHFATPNIRPGSIEDVSLTRFVRLWTNVAKFGNPTPDKNDKVLNVEWKRVSGANLDYLEIGETLVPKSNPDAERIGFWRKLYAESPAGRKAAEK